MFDHPAYPKYCEKNGFRGLSCDESDLELLEVVQDIKSETFVIKDTIYRCRVCKGIYKHCLFEKLETRNLDCDAGWWTPLDRFFKIEEDYANNPPLKIAEARKYGFKGEDFTVKDNRCNFEETPSGLTCKSGSLEFVAWADPEKNDLYDEQIQKCKKCGQIYKQIWIGRRKFFFIKPPHVYYFPAEEAAKYGFKQ